MIEWATRIIIERIFRIKNIRFRKKLPKNCHAIFKIREKETEKRGEREKERVRGAYVELVLFYPARCIKIQSLQAKSKLGTIDEINNVITYVAYCGKALLWSNLRENKPLLLCSDKINRALLALSARSNVRKHMEGIILRA